MKSAIRKFFKSSGVRLLTVAPFVVAAKLLDDKRTAHTELKIPIPDHSQSISSSETNFQLANDLRRTKLTVWDKIVINHRHI